MGLFKKAPLDPPAVRRPDLAQAMSQAPRSEMEYLRRAQPELSYIEASLPPDEPITAAASCDVISAYASGFSGAAVITPRRIVAVLGRNGGGQLQGEPVVHVFPFPEVTVSEGRTPLGEAAASFALPGQAGVELQIGHEAEWSKSFFDAVRTQANRTKFN